MVPEAISFMNEEYDIDSGIAPTFADWCKKIEDMKGVADMKFLRAYFAGVISCFMCPTTKCSISPRCYGAISNLEEARSTNFCQLAIDQIIAEVKTMGSKKNSVCCCVYHLVLNNSYTLAFFCFQCVTFLPYRGFLTAVSSCWIQWGQRQTKNLIHVPRSSSPFSCICGRICTQSLLSAWTGLDTRTLTHPSRLPCTTVVYAPYTTSLAGAASLLPVVSVSVTGCFPAVADRNVEAATSLLPLVPVSVTGCLPAVLDCNHDDSFQRMVSGALRNKKLGKNFCRQSTGCTYICATTLFSL